MATKQQKIDFISKYIVFKMTDGSNKKLTKKELNSGVVSDSFIDRTIESNKKAFEEYLNSPKLIHYYADCMVKDGERVTYDIAGYNEEDCKTELMKRPEITSVIKIVSKKGNHLCKYCGGGIVAGTNKDLLCNDCISLFGHHFYSEL